jgi:hypothetical protein
MHIKKTMASRLVLSAVLLAASAALSAADAPAPAAPAASSQAGQSASPAHLSSAQRDGVLEQLYSQIGKFYVFPEKRTAIIDVLRRAQRAGRYNVDSPSVFAERVTEDLQRASHDAHLNLNFDPDWYAAATAQPDGESSGSSAYERMAAQQDNHGLIEMKVLLGNVRYLRITGFSWIQDETGAVYDNAMRFLRDGAAIILDLRGNRGGSSEATRYLVSHFLDEDVPLYTFLSQKEPTRISRALGYLPAGRIHGKLAYVLIDGRVRSAGEDVAYQFQQYRLGQLVGTKTVGAANNNDHVPVAPGFRFSLSVGRPVHPISKSNWEGVGIEPDLRCPPHQALDTAYIAALDQLVSSPQATPLMKAEYVWARDGARARLQSRSADPPGLGRLAGAYSGVQVELRDGALWMQRPGREATRLQPMGGDMFFVEGVEELRVRLTTSALTLLVLGAPEPREYPRS